MVERQEEIGDVNVIIALIITSAHTQESKIISQG